MNDWVHQLAMLAARELSVPDYWYTVNIIERSIRTGLRLQDMEDAEQELTIRQVQEALLQEMVPDEEQELPAQGPPPVTAPYRRAGPRRREDQLEVPAPLRCPKCNSRRVYQQVLAWDPGPDQHRHDPNKRGCDKCGLAWWIPCPVPGCPRVTPPPRREI